MKKTILAVAVTALFASAANAARVYDDNGTSLDIYGRGQINGYNQVSGNGEAYSEDNSGDMTIDGKARVGIEARVPVNGTWSGLARAEYQVSQNDTLGGADSFARHLYTGFTSCKYGTIIAGQTDSPFFEIMRPIDIFNEYGVTGSSLRTRPAGQVIYSQDLGDLEFKIGGQFDEGNNNAMGNGGSTAITYHIDDNWLMTGGVEIMNTDDTNAHYGLSTSWGSDGLYLAAAVSGGNAVKEGKRNGFTYMNIGDSFFGFDLAATYTMDKWKFLGGFSQIDADYSFNQAILGVEYAYTSHLKTYVEYAMNGGDTNEDDAYSVGLQYNF